MSAVTNVRGYDRWARYVVLCQGKSGSGASLGACDAAWVRTCVGVPLSHCMSDRMFLPLGVDSHGRIASVQRRVKGFLCIWKRASVDGWIENLLCAD